MITTGHRQHGVLGLGARFFHRPAQGLADRLDVLDILLGDGIGGQRLDAVAFHSVSVFRFAKLDHLYGRRADIDTDHGRFFGAEEKHRFFLYGYEVT